MLQRAISQSYCTVIPPSIAKSVPETMLELSLSKYRTGSTTSDSSAIQENKALGCYNRNSSTSPQPKCKCRDKMTKSTNKASMDFRMLRPGHICKTKPNANYRLGEIGNADIWCACLLTYTKHV